MCLEIGALILNFYVLLGRSNCKDVRFKYLFPCVERDLNTLLGWKIISVSCILLETWRERERERERERGERVCVGGERERERESGGERNIIPPPAHQRSPLLPHQLCDTTIFLRCALLSAEGGYPVTAISYRGAWHHKTTHPDYKVTNLVHVTMLVKDAKWCYGGCEIVS